MVRFNQALSWVYCFNVLSRNIASIAETVTENIVNWAGIPDYKLARGFSSTVAWDFSFFPCSVP